MSRVGLAAGPLALELAPGLGGSVASFRRDGVDLMRPLVVPAGAAPHALHSGMFPMVPFANSIRDNRFVFEGVAHEVRPNMEGARLNYHGSGWHLPWRVAEAGPAQVELRLDGASVDDVYRYDARQTFALTPEALTVTIEVTNRGAAAMPFTFGLHPWFPRHGDAVTAFAASGLWLEDADYNADRLVAIAPERDYAGGRPPPRSHANTCYAGWNGVATIRWAGLGLGLDITADPVFGHLMFHVPAHDPETFCLEPQTNRTSGFDGLDTPTPAAGVHVLAPGVSAGGSVRFHVTAAG